MVSGIPPKWVMRLGVRLVPAGNIRRGWYPAGEHHWCHKLTDHDVELFRQLVESGVSQREACEKFQISRGYGSKLMNYQKRRTPTTL